jgi:hypothetical protein
MGRRKCLHHPAMKCPTPDEPCIFTRTEKPKKTKPDVLHLTVEKDR